MLLCQRQRGQQAGELASLSGLSPCVAQPPSVSASEQYCLPVLLIMIHDKLLTFGKGLNLFAESCSGDARVTSLFSPKPPFFFQLVN